MKWSLFIAIIFIGQFSYGQVPPMEWAGSSGGTQSDNVHGMAVDFQGNVINVGRFRGIADYDPGPGSTTIQANGSSWNSYIQKVNSNGTLAWVGSLFGVLSSNSAFDVATDSQGNIYITGIFTGTVDFDPTAGTNSLTAIGQQDTYILKLSSAGGLIWVKTITGFVGGEDIVVDNNDNVIVTGSFEGTSDFDPGVNVLNESSVGSKDGFVLKLNGSGDYIWHKTLGGTNIDLILSVDLNPANDIFISGTFASTADLEAGVGVTNYTANGASDVFIEKLDQSGNFVWVKTFGGTGNEYPSEIHIDINGNVLGTGWFQGTMDIDPGVNQTLITSAGDYDQYVQKLDGNGTFIFGVGQGSSATDGGEGITTDNNGNIYLTGTFTNTVDFDPGIGTFTLTALGASFTPFVQKLSSAGTFDWAFSYSTVGSGNQTGVRVKLNSTSSSLYINGNYSTSTDFDPGAGTNVLTSNGSVDSYIVKFSLCSATTSSITEVACDSHTAPDGQLYNSTGIYTATIPNTQGCDSIITIDLTINTVDVSTTQIDAVTIEANQSGAQYQWVDCDNSFAAISGETNQTFVASANGNYAVIVDDVTCADTSDCRVISTVGIEELAHDKKTVVKIVDIMGRETEYKKNTPLIFIFGDGTRQRIFEIE